MRVVTIGPHLWVCLAEWHGETRVVFGPATLEACNLWEVAFG